MCWLLKTDKLKLGWLRNIELRASCGECTKGTIFALVSNNFYVDSEQLIRLTYVSTRLKNATKLRTTN